MEHTAQAIAAGDLSRRVPEADPGTEVGRLGNALNGMLSQIETAFRAQAESEATARESEGRMRRFIADASHELRTPLSVIRGFAEYYRQRDDVERAELDRLIGRVEDEAVRMGVLVDDLLLLARLDQQRPLARRPVDLLALAADAVQDARVVDGDREITLSVRSDSAFIVTGDEVRLRQVIGNLVNNALRHTPAGSPVEVIVRSGRLGDSAAAVLEVADHGPGLPPEHAERVVERFYRADPARGRGGTGLGLAIVAGLVEAHGGTVGVESEAGKGATFRVVLPLDPDAVDSDSPEPVRS
jgi:two-component system OmpR family sensor kinase